MANYNTFILIDCKTRKPLITTSSARKVARQLNTGLRIEIWNNNELVTKVYKSCEEDMKPYIEAERKYIQKKQEKATIRNAQRRAKLERKRY